MRKPAQVWNKEEYRVVAALTLCTWGDRVEWRWQHGGGAHSYNTNGCSGREADTHGCTRIAIGCTDIYPKRSYISRIRHLKDRRQYVRSICKREVSFLYDSGGGMGMGVSMGIHGHGHGQGVVHGHVHGHGQGVGHGNGHGNGQQHEQMCVPVRAYTSIYLGTAACIPEPHMRM